MIKNGLKSVVRTVDRFWMWAAINWVFTLPVPAIILLILLIIYVGAY